MKNYFLVFSCIFIFSLKATIIAFDTDSTGYDILLSESEDIDLLINHPGGFWGENHASVTNVSLRGKDNNRQVRNEININNSDSS